MMSEDVKQKEEKLEIFIPNGPRLGGKVIEAKGVSKSYGEKLLFENLDLSIPPASIVGIIGPNGAGKTTLFRLMMGQEKPENGQFTVGDTVKLGYVDQAHTEIDPEKDVWQTISGGHEHIQLGGRQMNSRAYVARFNFTGADQAKKPKCFQVASATACTWRSHFAPKPMCFYLMNLPTTLM
jgi:energy-dependent translational throttle protein EttA